MACAFIVVYKAKTALTSFILKVAMKRFTSRDIAKYAVPVSFATHRCEALIDLITTFF
eukprot:SAG31_NODE_1089_length_9972_cov_4.602856_5_plen_58_part_00